MSTCKCCKKSPCSVIIFTPVQYYETDREGYVSLDEVGKVNNETFTYYINSDLLNPIKYDISYFTQIDNNQATGIYFDLCSCEQSYYPSKLKIYDNTNELYIDNYKYIALSSGNFFNSTVNTSCLHATRSDYDREAYKHGGGMYIFNSGDYLGNTLIDLREPHPYKNAVHVAPNIVQDANPLNPNKYPEVYRPNGFSLGGIEGIFSDNNVIIAMLEMCKSKSYATAQAYTSCTKWQIPCLPEGTTAFFSCDVSFKNPINAMISDIQKIKNVDTQHINYPILYKIKPPSLPSDLSYSPKIVNVTWSTIVERKDSIAVPVTPYNNLIKVGDNAKNVAAQILTFNAGSVTFDSPDKIYIEKLISMVQSRVFGIQSSEVKYLSLSGPFMGPFKSIQRPAPNKFDIEYWPIESTPITLSFSNQVGLNGVTGRKYYTFPNKYKNKNGTCFNKNGTQYLCLNDGFCSEPIFYDLDPSIGEEEQLITKPIAPVMYPFGATISILPIPPKNKTYQATWHVAHSIPFEISQEFSDYLKQDKFNNSFDCFEDPYGVSSYTWHYPVVVGVSAPSIPTGRQGDFETGPCDQNNEPMIAHYGLSGPVWFQPWDQGFAYGDMSVTVSVQ